MVLSGTGSAPDFAGKEFSIPGRGTGVSGRGTGVSGRGTENSAAVNKKCCRDASDNLCRWMLISDKTMVVGRKICTFAPY